MGSHSARNGHIRSHWPTDVHTNVQWVLEQNTIFLIKRERFSRDMPFVLPLCLPGMQLQGWRCKSHLWAQRRRPHSEDDGAAKSSQVLAGSVEPSCPPSQEGLSLQFISCERKPFTCYSHCSQGSVKCNHSPILTDIYTILRTWSLWYSVKLFPN